MTELRTVQSVMCTARQSQIRIAFADRGFGSSDLWENPAVRPLSRKTKEAWDRFVATDPNWMSLHFVDLDRFAGFVNTAKYPGRRKPGDVDMRQLLTEPLAHFDDEQFEEIATELQELLDFGLLVLSGRQFGELMSDRLGE